MTTSPNRQNQIESHLRDSIAVKEKMLAALVPQIEAVADLLTHCLSNGGKVLFCGNGGSAADAQHLATELVVRLRSSFERPALAALALTVDTSVLTAAGNDYGFDRIFSRQVAALGRPGDILIGISTSGNSPNIIEAVREAGNGQLKTIGFLGGKGGKLAAMTDYSLIIPSEKTMRIQEGHILAGHIICELVEEHLFPKSAT